jgi:hypothetical protein
MPPPERCWQVVACIPDALGDPHADRERPAPRPGGLGLVARDAGSPGWRAQAPPAPGPFPPADAPVLIASLDGPIRRG